jgi:hypothetical protein
MTTALDNDQIENQSFDTVVPLNELVLFANWLVETRNKCKRPDSRNRRAQTANPD